MNEADGNKDTLATEHVGANEEAVRAATKAAEVPAEETTGTGANANANAVRNDEVGGPSGPEPTRFGDWERKGRCIDF